MSDLDRDGVPDIAVGAIHDDDGGSNRGAVWILCFHLNGTVKRHQKISDTAGGFTGQLRDEDKFGVSITSLFDISHGGEVSMAVGANSDDDGAAGDNNRGAVWILFLR